jgi:cation:H+ antiporter
MIVDTLLVVAGATALVFAADRLVSSSGGLAARLGISPVVIGAVVIGFGSSLPEMLVSLASLDQPNGLDLAIGNVIGSNIANIGLVLGFSVLLFPFAGPSVVIRREGFLMMGSLVLMSIFLWDQTLLWWEAAFLLLGLLAAGLTVVRWSREDRRTPQPVTEQQQSLTRLGLVALVSLVALALAARVMVIGAEGLAIEFGLSEGVVGLTILALGTSLPELGTVVASARKGHNDLVLGNVLGSNLFNSLGVAGMSGLIGGGALATNFRADLIVMLAIAAFAGVAAMSGDRYHRFEGALMLSAYPAAIWVAL